MCETWARDEQVDKAENELDAKPRMEPHPQNPPGVIHKRNELSGQKPPQEGVFYRQVYNFETKLEK